MSMTSDHRTNLKLIVVATAAFALVLYSCLLLYHGVVVVVLAASIIRVVGIATVGGLVWACFERYGWANRIARRAFAAPPDLRGRWKGSFKSSVDQSSRDLVLEVHQTLLSLHCTAFGPGNRSEGYSCRILSDKDANVFKLAYLFRAAPFDVTTARQGDVHEGMAVLDLNENETPKRLRGVYFTTREPMPSKGYIDLFWEGIALQGHL